MKEVVKCIIIVTAGAVTAVCMIVEPAMAPIELLMFGLITCVIAIERK